MISLIPLASAWGWYPDVDSAKRVVVGIVIIIVALGVLVSALRPEKKSGDDK